MTFLLFLNKKMKRMQAIENWMSAIENSSQDESAKQQEIKEIVDLWKFADSCEGRATISQKGELLLENADGNFEKVNVLCSDIILDSPENVIAKVISEIEAELAALGPRYTGLYNVELRSSDTHFDAAEIGNLKSEIISGIKGEVILYKYVERIRKLPSSELKIINRDFRILECSPGAVSNMIANTRPLKKTIEKQWLVLMLSSIDHGCKSFLVDKAIKTMSFESDFDKIFIFDFYTSEIIELEVAFGVPNPADGVPTSANGVA